MFVASFGCLSISFAATKRPTKKEMTIAFCTGQEIELLQLAKKYQDINDEDEDLQSFLLDQKEIRKQIISFLNNSAKVLEELRNDDSGPIGSLMMCQVVNNSKSAIRKKGCYDFETSEFVKDNSRAIELCESLSK